MEQVTQLLVLTLVVVLIFIALWIGAHRLLPQEFHRTAEILLIVVAAIIVLNLALYGSHFVGKSETVTASGSATPVSLGTSEPAIPAN